MKILLVTSFNNGAIAPFIEEQAAAIRKLGVEISIYKVVGKGIGGYLSNLKPLNYAIKTFRPDLIHAHYGLCGLLANIQRQIPVVTTYHGSDINNKKILWFSKIAMRLSAYNIFVSQKNIDKSRIRNNFKLIPCGVNTSSFMPFEKDVARKEMRWNESDRIVLFAGSFDNPVKNIALAQKAVSLLRDVQFYELKGYTRNQTAILMNAADVLLLTSFTEGSPQVIKEAMACGCPIVSVDVGDVKERMRGLLGCYVASRSPEDIAKKIEMALHLSAKTDGPQRIKLQGLDNETVAQRIIDIYQQICTK